MPELPEVETLRSQLEKEIVGRNISEIKINFSGRLNMSAEDFSTALTGSRIIKISRRAKLLQIVLDSRKVLLVHLKMSGRFLLKNSHETPTKHTHVVFVIGDGRELHFEDMRKFGYLHLVSEEEAEKICSSKYGVEPLSNEISAKIFSGILRKKPNAKIKPLLLNQTFIAGIGNIYADEACYAAKIHPATKVGEIDDEKFGVLFSALQEALLESIKRRGTSSDKFLDLYGSKGENSFVLNVYGREDDPCSRCKTPISKIRLGGRGTHFCPKCQKL